MSRNFLVPGQPLAVVSLFVAAMAVAGCGSNVVHLPNPPNSTVTFPSASTQGWLQQYGSGSTRRSGDTAYGVATDPQGDVLVLDQTVGAFPGFTNPNQAPEFAVIKFSSSGARLWTQQFGTGNGDYPDAIATDALGNVFVVGSTNGAFPGATNPNQIQEGIVIKLNSSGQILWTLQSPSTGASQVTSVAVDAENNVIVAGQIPGSRAASGSIVGGYIAKLGGVSGQTLWMQGNTSSSSRYQVSAVAVGPQGSAFAVGQFPGNSTTGNGAGALYQVAKFNGSTGQVLWTQVPAVFSWQPNPGPLYTQIALDPAGNVVLGGLDGSSGYDECAVAKLVNASGATQWQQEFGAAQSCIPGGIATDTAGNVLLTGNVNGSFFSTSSTSSASFKQDVFLAKLSSAGQGVWLQQFGTGNDNPLGPGGYTVLTFLATDAENRADIAGTTEGAFSGFTNANGVNQLFVTQFGS